MSVSEDVIWLDDIECHRTELAGGKGASLGRMTGTGMPVPPGFVVTAGALSDSLATGGVLEKVRDLARSFEVGAEGGRIAGEIQAIVLSSPPSEELADHISSAYQSLGPDVPVAVRSSACAEDGESASFAGQQETFLNVIGSENVVDGVVRCWTSFFTERALFYRRSKGSLADLQMAVVVQQQIAADKSGVIFTTDPIRQRSDQMVIEAGYGLGEALVSGLITPDNYVARRDGRLKKARLGQQDQMTVRVAGGGTTTVRLDDEIAGSQVLDQNEISRLVEVGLQLEAAFGSPQDIEWAFEADRLYVLQSRPITT
ncbi:MAG: PEP/pyruvate-binding domain-containing protein [Acidimicrobiia bacterium]